MPASYIGTLPRVLFCVRHAVWKLFAFLLGKFYRYEIFCSENCSPSFEKVKPFREVAANPVVWSRTKNFSDLEKNVRMAKNDENVSKEWIKNLWINCNKSSIKNGE